MVFARQIAGQTLSFGVSGRLIMNAVVMYDHQTETLWSQFLAVAVDGPLKGTAMELLPSQLTTWGAWKEQHPDTLLLDRTVGGSGFRDSYSIYYNSNSAGILGESNKDRRLPVKELIVGLDHGGERIAYAFSKLANQPVVNDVYEGEPVLVTHDPAAGAAAAFTRTLNGEVLAFDSVDDMTMRDCETGSLWSAVRGEALSGPLAGAQLEQLPAFVSFWFAWSDFYPGTEVWEPETTPAT